MGVYYRALILSDESGEAAGHFGAAARFYLGKWRGDFERDPWGPDLTSRVVADHVLEQLDAQGGYQRRALLTLDDAIEAIRGVDPGDDLGWNSYVATLLFLSTLRPRPRVLVLIAADS